MPYPSPYSATVAVIGAGMAGLSCAAHLTRQGWSVTLFEREAVTGGRAGGAPGLDIPCDPGAQYFRARSEAFRAEAEAWIEAGTAARWRPRVASIGPGRKVFRADPEPRFVGVPTMAAAARAAGAEVLTGFPVSAIAREGAGWTVTNEEQGRHHQAFQTVVLAVPPDEAARLLAAAPALQHHAAGISMRPCWAVAAEFGRPLDVDFDGVFFESGAVTWAARDSSKPGRERGERWVFHADPDWSLSHGSHAPGAVKRVLLDAFFKAVEHPQRAPLALDCHYWPQARTANPLGEAVLGDPAMGLTVCGDWVYGDSSVEHAWLSGLAAAQWLLTNLSGGISRYLLKG